MPASSKEFPAGTHISYQVAPEDCTGCGDCVEACPIHDKSNVSRRAVNMAPVEPLRDHERDNLAFFLSLPEFDRGALKHGTLPGAMLLDPLFEFSGACAGCGETPYIRLATQLFGDRMLVANATGCSSIYGGNLPSTPYTVNGAGRGPAWSNSLFEDNAEFGLGMRLAADQLHGLCEAVGEGNGRRKSAATSPTRCSVPSSARKPASSNSAAVSPSCSTSCQPRLTPARRNSPASPNG